MTDNSSDQYAGNLIMMLFITWAIVTACFLVLTRILHPLVLFRRHRYIRQKSAIRDKRHSSEKKRACDRRTRPKPPWVLKEVIHLQAMYPRKGCRAISYLFNRLYEHDKHITVGKAGYTKNCANTDTPLLLNADASTTNPPKTGLKTSYGKST